MKAQRSGLELLLSATARAANSGTSRARRLVQENRVQQACIPVLATYRTQLVTILSLSLSLSLESVKVQKRQNIWLGPLADSFYFYGTLTLETFSVGPSHAHISLAMSYALEYFSSPFDILFGCTMPEGSGLSMQL